MERYTLASIAVIVLSFALSICFYSAMPDLMASHWGFAGEANGYSGKPFALFFLPVLEALLFALLIYLPKTDPIRENVQKNRGVYGWTVFTVLAFLTYVHLLSIGWNLGVGFGMGAAIALGFAVLLYFLGWAMERVERNWFIGIRTPWAISDEGNWKKTHALGAKLFKASAAISLFGVVFEKMAIALVIVPVIASAIICFAYSYLEYRKSANKKKGGKRAH